VEGKRERCSEGEGERVVGDEVEREREGAGRGGGGGGKG